MMDHGYSLARLVAFDGLESLSFLQQLQDKKSRIKSGSHIGRSAPSGSGIKFYLSQHDIYSLVLYTCLSCVTDARTFD